MERNYPSIDIHGTTFNAAGVHPNTIAPATGASVNAFYVGGEILTTLQSKASTIPFIGTVFNWAKAEINETGLPSALGNPIPMPPYELTEDIADAKPLPVLWPLSQETLVLPRPNDFATITTLNNLLASSAAPVPAMRKLIDYLDSNYRAKAEKEMEKSGKSGTLETHEEEGDLWMGSAQDELSALQKIAGESFAYHGMDYVIAAYEHRLLEKGSSP